jgi:carbamoyltransferase
MRVLGISPLDKDANVSLMEDGKVLFACGEERLSRVKLQSGFPHRALQEGLTRLKWDPQSIDAVAYAFFDWDEEARLIAESVGIDARRVGPKATAESCALYRAKIGTGYKVDRTARIPGLDTEAAEFTPAKAWYKRLVYEKIAHSPKMDYRAHMHLFKKWQRNAVDDHRRWSGELAAGLKRVGLDNKPLRRFQHHDTHAANAFYASPFDDALVVTLDGYGSGMCGGIYTADAGGIRTLHRYRFPSSMGIFYEHVTSGLGFKPSRHEGKIVGLASYGDPKVLADILLARFDTADGDIVIRNGQNHFFTRALTTHFAKRDIAAAYQWVLEEVTRRSVSYWLAKTGKTKVVVSGGVHANVKLNQRIREIPGVDGLFVYPNMGDGGCGTGAAMLVFGHEVMKKAGPFDTVYFGPDYTEAQIKAALDKEGLKYERFDAPEERIAELLSQDHIIGRFNGRMEYGPRALGNRSVLYPAKEPEVNQWLNHQLARTEFMPFAPSCLAEFAPKLYHNLGGCEKTAEFMTVTFDCTEWMKGHSPAAVHVDGTARPQLVTPKSNPSYHKLISAYEKRTGIPVVINTSFNMHEEPIVCSPEDAVRAFLLGNVDYLAAGPFMVPHPKLAENLKDREKTKPGKKRELAGV